MYRNVRKMADLLLPAILKDFKIFGLKIGNLFPALVGYAGVNLNEVCGDANDVFITGSYLLCFGRWLRRRQRLRLLPSIRLGQRRNRKGALQEQRRYQ